MRLVWIWFKTPKKLRLVVHCGSSPGIRHPTTHTPNHIYRSHLNGAFTNWFGSRSPRHRGWCAAHRSHPFNHCDMDVQYQRHYRTRVYDAHTRKAVLFAVVRFMFPGSSIVGGDVAFALRGFTERKSLGRNTACTVTPLIATVINNALAGSPHPPPLAVLRTPQHARPFYFGRDCSPSA